VIAAAFGEAMSRSRVRLAWFQLVGLKTRRLHRWDRTDHVSPCPQSAGAAMQVGVDHLRGRALERDFGHA